jgi:hypothetical protein
MPVSLHTRRALLASTAILALVAGVAAARPATTSRVKLSVRAALLKQTSPTTWRGSAVSPQLGRGKLTLVGKVTFRSDTNPSRSRIRFRATFKSGSVSGCFYNTVLLRPGDRQVWDGPGQVTATSAALRRYRGVLVHDGGLTPNADHSYAKPFEFSTDAPGKRC